MSKLCLRRNEGGFTLVEILVVMVIMGLVMTAVFSLFINNKRTSTTTEEVIDVQQNLRVALETMVSDIRMAGFLIPSDSIPIASAPDVFGVDGNSDGDLLDGGDSGNFFTLQTSSSVKTYARVLGESYNSGTSTITLTVEDDMVPSFTADHFIRVIRGATQEDLSGTDWDVTSVNTGANTISAAAPGYVEGTIEAGDMVVRKLAGGEDYPAVINYWLRPTAGGGTNNLELVRNDGNSTGVIANYISAVDLTYILTDGTESNNPADPADVKAVRVTMTAQTDNTKTGQANFSGVKSRSLQTLVKIRNAIGD